MIKVEYLKDIDKINYSPNEAIEMIGRILSVLDSEYEKIRNADDGGYAILVENKKDSEIIRSYLYLDL